MVTGNPKIHVFFYIAALLMAVALVLMAPMTPGAEDKTPPYYPEDSRSKGRVDPRVNAPVKDFPSLFREQATPVAETVDEPPPLDDGAFRTEEYVVQEGDWLVKILREKGLIQEHNLPELLTLLRRLNSSLHDLNMIQPGEKIVILVKVVPGSETGERTKDAQTHRQLKYEPYRVKRGDILSRVAMDRFHLSKRTFNREYLRLFRACNPHIQDPNLLAVGQTINLPLYPPEHEVTQKGPPVLRDLEKSPRRVRLKAPRMPETIEPSVKRPKPRPAPRPAPAKQPPERAPEPPETETAESPEASWPEYVRPVTPGRAPERTVSEKMSGPATIIIADGLGTVISRMGEEWIHSGEHVIPLKSGGHIDLDAASYPIVRLEKGLTVIVDMHNALPETMARVLESTWANYRVVQLSAGDDLRSALDKILEAFGYADILRQEPLKLGGSVPLTITADWIVTQDRTDSGKAPGFLAIYLMDHRGRGLPRVIKDYLRRVNVEVIEYPSPVEEGPTGADARASLRTAPDIPSLIESILDLRGIPFATRTKVPAYATRNRDFQLTVQADFYLDTGGHRRIIDIGGLNPNVVSVLNDNGISVLSLAGEKDPVEAATKALSFLDVPFENGPHAFMAHGGDTSRNVKLTFSGISFFDRKGASVFATSVSLPPELVAFLAQKGYRVLALSPLG
jgi:hypothetical protein